MKKLYHFDGMQVGDSFLVYFTRNQNAVNLRKSVISQAHRFRMERAPGWEFSVMIESEPVPCIRVTRIQ